MKPNQQTIEELAPRLASGELAAVLLIDECLQAIADHDRALSAMLALDPRAIDEARACDREQNQGRLRGPLHGIPLVVKDNTDVAGLATSSGNRAMAGAMPLVDAAQVARLKRAGAIVIGKANLSEFSFEIRSRSSLGGDVRNPFDVSVTSGGSSGGTAVALAAGFAVAGLGSDTGGSIRVPAAFNGLVGLRPTHGLLDGRGVAPLAPSTDTIAPMARSVADAALLFGLMGGDGRLLGTEGLRVGVLRQAFGSDPEIAAASDGAIETLAASGVFVTDPVTLEESVLPVGRLHIVDHEFAEAFDNYLATNFEPGTGPGSLRDIIASGRFLPDHAADLDRRLMVDRAQREAILAYHRSLRVALEQLFDKHQLDALLFPTSMIIPSSLENPKGGWAPELAACSGWPALSVPAGVSRRGIPVGVELLGRRAREPLLFGLGAAIERSVGPRPIPKLS